MRKDAAITVLATLTLTCALAFLLGLALADNWTVSPAHRAAIESLHLDTAIKMRWIKIGFWGGLGGIALFGLGGVMWGLLRAVWRRSRLITPHPSGLFPIVEGRAGNETYYHDPNRQLTGTVAYGAGPEGIAVRHLAPPHQEEMQFQIASQAQATQLVAAASQGRAPTAQTRRLIERAALAPPAQPVPRLPQVVVLDESTPEERRLLAALRQDWTVEAEGGE